MFGGIEDGLMRLNEAGKIVAEEWIESDAIRREIVLDEWVVMPNHFHGIVFITDPDDRNDTLCSGISSCRGDRPVAPTGPAPKSLGALIAGFKSVGTKRINELHKTPGAKLWQRNYWEHVIRNERDLVELREYIRYNPAQWEFDKFYLP